MRFGSLDNMLMNANDPERATVGMKVTVLGWTDRAPGIITEVKRHPKTGKVISVEVQELEWKCKPFPNGYAEEVFMDRPKGSPSTYKVITRGKRKGMLPDLALGEHDAYRDPSF